MGEFWRSESMQLVQLFVQIDAAHDTVDELGKLGIIQFKDLNPEVSPFQRNFVSEVKRCDEMERRLRFFDDQLVKEKKEEEEEKKFSPERDEFSRIKLEESRDEEESPAKYEHLDELDTHLDEMEKEILQMNTNQEMLSRNNNELVELRYVLLKDQSFFDETLEFEKPISEESDSQSKPLVDRGAELSKAVKIGFITGVIQRDSFTSFERVLWRVLRGNLFMKHAEIEEPIKEPASGEFVSKNVFCIFFQGERSNHKIKKICESFRANVYPVPETARERKDLLSQVNNRIEDLQKVLDKTRRHRMQVLSNINQHLKSWKEKVLKEKAIYHTMNMFNYDVGRKLLIAEGWCTKTSTEKIVNAMRQATESSGALVPSVLSVVETPEEPPTHYKTNRFTRVFLGIVEAYGVAQYREVNPAAFTIITFPFLFAVMFGDFGHGLLMTLFASFLIWKEKKLATVQLNEMVRTCYDGRYVLILMGMFSMYTGLLYNECFSIPIDLCGTNWKYVDVDPTSPTIAAFRIDTSRTYEFGVDPAWAGSANSLMYYNSMKMKLSVILGVTHMCLGIFMSLLNGLHFRKPLNIFGEFLPQILFMLSLFGYLCFLVFFKWSYSWAGQSPPFLLNVMISMFLKPTDMSPDEQVFTGQLYVQWALVILALICVPWMLCTKPYVLKKMHERRMAQKQGQPVVEETHQGSHGGHDEGEGDNFDFGEIAVKQIIHTIEFVLGAISNTASYLRLWALSLAHSELSQVFWERVLVKTYQMGGFYMVFVGYAIWFGATLGVLMIMESLSAFLHALRLHWVEFQNKFYHGDGYKFAPFSYEHLFTGGEEDQ